MSRTSGAVSAVLAADSVWVFSADDPWAMGFGEGNRALLRLAVDLGCGRQHHLGPTLLVRCIGQSRRWRSMGAA
jgi:hypothetical protein